MRAKAELVLLFVCAVLLFTSFAHAEKPVVSNTGFGRFLNAAQNVESIGCATTVQCFGIGGAYVILETSRDGTNASYEEREYTMVPQGTSPVVVAFSTSEFLGQDFWLRLRVIDLVSGQETRLARVLKWRAGDQ